MTDYELRRLDLKSQILSSQIKYLDIRRIEAATELKQRENHNRTAEKTWSQFLSATVTAYRKAPPELQAQLLGSSIKALADSKKIINTKKNVEEKIREKLHEIFINFQTKDAQLIVCQKKRKVGLEVLAERKEQALSEELARLVVIKKQANLTPVKGKGFRGNEDGEALDIPSGDSSNNYEKVTLENPSNRLLSLERLQLHEAATSHSELGAVSLLLPAPNPQESFRQSAVAIDHAVPLQPQLAQQKWDQAQVVQNKISDANRGVQVLVVHNQQGISVNLDYLLAPGRRLAIEGNAKSANKAITLCLSASNSNDRMQINSQKRNIEEVLKDSGIKLQSLELRGE